MTVRPVSNQQHLIDVGVPEHAPPSPVGVVLENVSKRYRIYSSPHDRLREVIGLRVAADRVMEVSALNGVSLRINKGEFCGVIGRNGAGKSTFLKVIAGQIAPTEGSVRVVGRRSLLQLGVGFDGELTGRENIHNSLRYTQMGAAISDQLVDEIVKFAEIGDFINFPIKTYSSGMYSRLAFATAVAVDPDILIADEVLAVGDINFLQKCLAKMRSFKESGKTVILVTHDLSTVRVFCDRALLFENGKIIRDGDPTEVCETYRNLMLYGVTAAPIAAVALHEPSDGEESQCAPEPAHAQSESAGADSARPDGADPTNEAQPPSVKRLDADGASDSETAVAEWLYPRKETLVSMIDAGKVLAVRMRYPHERRRRSAFEGGQRVCFDCVFQLREEFQFHSLGFTMHDSRGQIVLHLNSEFDEFKLRQLQSQQLFGVSFEFYLPLLTTGQYSLVYGVSIFRDKEGVIAFKHDFDFSIEIGYPRNRRLENQGGLVLVDKFSVSELDFDHNRFAQAEAV